MHAVKMPRAGASSRLNLIEILNTLPSTIPRPELAALTAEDLAVEAALGTVDQSRMILSIYQGVLGREPWRETTQHLGAYMSSTAIMVIRPSSSTDLGFLVCHPRHPEIEHAYRAHFWTQDPFLEIPIDQVLTIDEHLGADNWLSSEFYQRIIGEGGARYGLGINIVSENGTLCRIRLYRLPEQPAFTQVDKDRLRELVAHFRKALSLAARLECQATQSELYEGALDRLHIGAIVLDENQKVLRCNHVAQSLLNDSDGLKRAGNGVEAYYRNERSILQELINSAGPAAQVMSVSRASGKRKLGLVVRSIPLREGSEGKCRPAWMIFVCDPDAQTTAPREIMRQVFEFTPAEANLAMELANGLSLDEAAELLGIRRNTARTHLRAIFAKAGVTRQAELVRLVLNGVICLSTPSPAG
ncbi:helix-turn-helix transcriptional regulator [Pseudomonas sp. GV085]|uniref:helix-turn-helix transcriptional regulator n=1 Tax=Pseudomonas sp. GV085 TaxID=2135756 RepID=UPI000D3BEEB3|nr:helix-turn-helix transcriptional regulator [Pseudomonas sp. GV085]PTR23780.1 DNA-binding CsgD family transcriptional regulator [Pseudomonas sp. GV085]